MKTFKKLCSAFLTLALICTFTSPALAAGEDTPSQPTFTIGNVTAAPGDTVEVSVYFDYADITNVNWVKSFFSCDEVITFVDAEPGQVISGMSSIDGQGFMVLHSAVDKSYLGVYFGHDDYTNLRTGGEYIVLTLQVDENALPGKYTIDMDTATADHTEILDGNLNLIDVEFSCIAGTVTVTSGGDSGGSDVLTDSNFSGPSEDYFTTAGIKVTPSEDDLSFTVACDNACVVAKDNGDGTYTRLTGTAVEDGYQFTAASASDNIVVALKGDANGDGKVNLADYALLVLQVKTDDSVHRDLSAIGTLTGDVNSDGKVNLADYALLVLQVKTDASIHRDLTWD